MRVFPVVLLCAAVAAGGMWFLLRRGPGDESSDRKAQAIALALGQHPEPDAMAHARDVLGSHDGAVVLTATDCPVNAPVTPPPVPRTDTPAGDSAALPDILTALPPYPPDAQVTAALAGLSSAELKPAELTCQPDEAFARDGVTPPH